MPINARPQLVFITPFMPDPHGTGSEQRAYSFLLAYSKVMDVTLWIGISSVGLHVKRLGDITSLCCEVYFYHASLLKNNFEGLHTKFVECLVAADHVHVFKLPFGIAHKSIIWDFDELPSDLRDADRPAAPVVLSTGEEVSMGSAFVRFSNSCRLRIASSPLETHDRLGPVAIVSNCYHTLNVRRRKEPATLGLLFVGAFYYLPNLDAVKFLSKDIVPHLPSRLTISLVGRKPLTTANLALLKKMAQDCNMTIAYDVARLSPYYDAASIAIVPLRLGSGTRLKILEAFAHGCPVVTTSKGCEGLSVTDNHEVLIRDRPKEFAQACIDLLEDAPRRSALAKAGRAFLKKHNSQSIVEKQLYAALVQSGILPAA